MKITISQLQFLLDVVDDSIQFEIGSLKSCRHSVDARLRAQELIRSHMAWERLGLENFEILEEGDIGVTE